MSIGKSFGCVVAACAALGLVVIGGAALAADTELPLVERATTDAIVDVGAEGDSAGDLLTFANDVYDKDNVNKVGTDNGWCIRTAAGVSWECSWTLTLADGQIMVAGPFLDAGDSALAITGGTGAYAGARGEMKLHARNPEGSEYDFTYLVKN